MSKYLVTVLAVVSKTLEVEADSEDDAYEAVWNHPAFPGGLCHACYDDVGDISDWEVDDTSIELLEE